MLFPWIPAASPLLPPNTLECPRTGTVPGGIHKQRFANSSNLGMHRLNFRNRVSERKNLHWPPLQIVQSVRVIDSDVSID